MEEFVIRLARAVVDSPDQVIVAEEEFNGSPCYVVTVAPGEVGQVVGRKGRVAESIRVIVSSIAKKSGRKVYVRIEAAALPPSGEIPDRIEVPVGAGL